MPTLRLRDATADDLAVTYEITKDAMRGYVEQTWGKWDEDEQTRKHSENFTPETHEIVLLGDDIAGLLATEELPDHLWLVKLYLLRAFRGQGLGSAALRIVLRRAHSTGKPVRLRVLRVNTGAQQLYLRHGFRIVEHSPERLFMERAVGAA